jgi:hypothetical protein
MRDRYRNEIFVTGEIIFVLEHKIKEKPKKPANQTLWLGLNKESNRQEQPKSS